MKGERPTVRSREGRARPAGDSEPAGMERWYRGRRERSVRGGEAGYCEEGGAPAVGSLSAPASSSAPATFSRTR